MTGGGLAWFPWAVHISDAVLTTPWWVGGLVVAALLAAVGAWRIQDEEIPRVALMTAAFFVASLFLIRIGPTSVHLLLNGLVGIVLGWRAALAIPVGLFLQAALMGHGGYTTVGINSCVMVLPALLAWQLFAVLRRLPWVRRRWFRSTLVAASALVWTLSLVYSVTLLVSNRAANLDRVQFGEANALTCHPLTLLGAAALALLAAATERRLENAPEFPVGLLVGEVSVLATVFLNCLVLTWGGAEDWHTIALINLVAHLPVAVIEGMALGFTVGFLARVKPELLGLEPGGVPAREAETAGAARPAWKPTEQPECSADPLR